MKKSEDPVVEAIAETFEMMKIGFNQSSTNGHTVTFQLDYEDLPERLIKARLNTRFAVSMVEIGDDEKPVLKPIERQKKKMNASVMRAGIACKEALFHRFLQRNYNAEWTFCKSEGEGDMQAAATMRKILNIDSRRDIGIDPAALLGFDRLLAEFEVWKRGELK